MLFDAGTSSRTLRIGIINDTRAEGDEIINLSLLNPSTGGTIGANGRAVITIVDDDKIAMLQIDRSVDFGTVSIGDSAMRAVNMKNTGNAPLTFTAPVITAGAEAGFSIASQPATLTLAPDQSTTFMVGFRPTAAAASTGTISLMSNGGNAVITLSGQGTGDFQLNITPPSLTLTQGSVGMLAIGAQTMSGFSAPITLSTTVTPATGVNLNLSGVMLLPNGLITLMVSTLDNAAPGVYSITITGTAGQTVRTQTATITVTEAADFSLAFPQPTLIITRGRSTQTTLNINRAGGFTDNVTISTPDTTPLKLKLTPVSQTTTGTSVQFTFKAKKKAPLGAQPIVFTGIDGTGRVRTATLTLVIQ